MVSFLLDNSSLLTPLLARNSTSAVERVGWVSSPDTRSTSEILWSCFSVFLVCSFKCVHLNLPTVQESEAGWHTLLAGWLPYWPTKPLRMLMLRKLMWMAIIVLAPEIGVALAAREYLNARRLQKAVGSPAFTLTHAFFVSMGGFAVALPAVEGRSLTRSPPSGSLSPTQNQRPMANVEYYFLAAEDIERFAKLGPFQATAESNTWFPQVTEADIENLSKSDPFTKAFAVIQCAWLVTQSIARVAHGLPLTELELATLAFIPCTVVMYGFWWYKPFDSQRAITLLCLDQDNADSARSTLYPRVDDTRIAELHFDYLREIMMPGWYSGSRIKEDDPVVAIFYIAAVVFSGIHAIAWTWGFPSPITRTLWRVFSLVAICSLSMNVVAWFSESVSRADDTPYTYDDGCCDGCIYWQQDCVPHHLPLFTTIGVVAYGVSRAALIVLMFYCFSSMPAGVYKAVDWNNVIPHFS